VCVLELNDPSHCNAIDWAMANDLQRAIERLKEMAQVRIGRLWMGGDGLFGWSGFLPGSAQRPLSALSATDADDRKCFLFVSLSFGFMGDPVLTV